MRGPITIYRATGIQDLDANALRKALKEDGLLPDVPPDLRFAEEERSGWGTVPLEDKEESIADLGDFLAIWRRVYSKRVPGRLLKRLVQQEMASEDRFDGPRRSKKTITEDIRSSLMLDENPDVSETLILLDLKGERALVFAPAAAARELCYALRTVLHRAGLPEIALHPLDLLTILRDSRGEEAHFPGSMPRRFMGWLANLLQETPWITLPTNEHPIRFSVSTDGAAVIDSEDGSISASGSEVERQIEGMIEQNRNGSVAHWITSLTLELSEDGRPPHRVKLSQDARILTWHPLLPDPDEEEIDQEASFLGDLADTAFLAGHAHRLVRALVEAFDATALQEWMDGDPQKQFWPGAPSGERPTFHASDPGVTVPSGPLFAAKVP